jgi:hypothetical protein
MAGKLVGAAARRLWGLGGAFFSLVQVLGGFAGLRGPPEDGVALTVFYTLAWVVSLHELFGTGVHAKRA